MKTLTALSLALALVTGGASVVAANEKVSREGLDHIMAAWPGEVRGQAERLVALYGLPDRVTATILVWDVAGTAQQQAMMRVAGERAHTAEAGAEASPVED